MEIGRDTSGVGITLRKRKWWRRKWLWITLGAVVLLLFLLPPFAGGWHWYDIDINSGRERERIEFLGVEYRQIESDTDFTRLLSRAGAESLPPHWVMFHGTWKDLAGRARGSACCRNGGVPLELGTLTKVMGMFEVPEDDQLRLAKAALARLQENDWIEAKMDFDARTIEIDAKDGRVLARWPDAEPR